MAGEWTSERYPQFEPGLRRLTEQHRELKDEPLHLAIAFLPHRNGRDVSQGIFLFEVIGGIAEQFGQSEDLFEVTFDAIPGVPTGFDQTLHLILTTPRELDDAVKEGRPLALEIVDAIRRGDYKVLHQDAVGGKLFRHLLANRPESSQVVIIANPPASDREHD
jgi:hypothetical protein